MAVCAKVHVACTLLWFSGVVGQKFASPCVTCWHSNRRWYLQAVYREGKTEIWVGLWIYKTLQVLCVSCFGPKVRNLCSKNWTQSIFKPEIRRSGKDGKCKAGARRLTCYLFPSSPSPRLVPPPGVCTVTVEVCGRCRWEGTEGMGLTCLYLMYCFKRHNLFS
jgi:hypothetical protein